jgi:hypothetical protein
MNLNLCTGKRYTLTVDRSASLLELLHTRHNACPGEMIALPFVMLKGTRLQQWQELGGCAKT